MKYTQVTDAEKALAALMDLIDRQILVRDVEPSCTLDFEDDERYKRAMQLARDVLRGKSPTSKPGGQWPRR